MTNRQLNRELERFGLCMPWNVVLENVRVAGIASTGTHGTGKTTATVGDLVEAFEVVDAEGRLRVLSEETVGAEVMSAARLGLGLFGVIARVRLRVVPIYRVRQTDQRLPVREVLDQLPELIRAHDSVELYWFPFNRDMWMRTVDRTDAPRTFHGHGFWFKTQNFLQNAWLVLFSKLVMSFAPGLTPALLRFGMQHAPVSHAHPQSAGVAPLSPLDRDDALRAASRSASRPIPTARTCAAPGRRPSVWWTSTRSAASIR